MDTDPLVEHLAVVRDMPLSNAVDWLCCYHGLGSKGGDHAICAESDPNIILDAGLSDAGAEAAIAIRRDPRFKNQPITGFEAMLIYACDGARMINMPFALRPPSGGYRKPHWCPTLVKLATDG